VQPQGLAAGAGTCATASTVQALQTLHLLLPLPLLPGCITAITCWEPRCPAVLLVSYAETRQFVQMHPQSAALYDLLAAGLPSLSGSRHHLGEFMAVNSCNDPCLLLPLLPLLLLHCRSAITSWQPRCPAVLLIPQLTLKH
jgi:hypothetical protein